LRGEWNAEVEPEEESAVRVRWRGESSGGDGGGGERAADHGYLLEVASPVMRPAASCNVLVPLKSVRAEPVVRPTASRNVVTPLASVRVLPVRGRDRGSERPARWRARPRATTTRW